jgi:hypothetical protein
MNEMQSLIDEINKLRADNHTNIQLNSTKIDNLRDDLMKAERARLLEQEQWKTREEQCKTREEQWKSFCKQQEDNFKRYVDAITSGQQKGSV